MPLLSTLLICVSNKSCLICLQGLVADRSATFCRASREASTGTRKFDTYNTTFQNTKVFHLCYYSVYKESNALFVGTWSLAYAFKYISGAWRDTADEH